MKISQIIQETTTAGSVAPTELGFVKMQTRNPSVYGGNKVGNLLKGKKTSKPFANSVNESKMKDLDYDMQTMKPAEFQKKYGKSREQMKASPINKPAQSQKPTPPVNEADLSEQDLIVVPGQGIKVKPGFHKIDPDKAEHEGQTLKNSLHTIIRVATQLDKQLSTQEHFPEWVSEKIGAVKGMITSVADYLISDEEMQHDPDAMESLGTTGAITNGEMGESLQRVDTLVTDALKLMRGSEVRDAVKALITVLGNREYNSRRGFYNFYIKQMIDMYNKQGVAEGAKVDRMVKHIAKSEKKLGHSGKEAENIAWATANKRGMLDNKNKKK